jgi:hypothetical protein
MQNPLHSKSTPGCGGGDLRGASHRGRPPRSVQVSNATTLTSATDDPTAEPLSRRLTVRVVELAAQVLMHEGALKVTTSTWVAQRLGQLAAANDQPSNSDRG